MPRLTIGWKLTLWYGAILGISLVVLGAFVFFSLSRSRLAEIDRALEEELAEIELEVRSATSSESRAHALEKYFGEHEFYSIQVSKPDGAILFTSRNVGAEPFPVPRLAADAAEESTDDVLHGGDSPYRMSSRIAESLDGPVIVQAADSLIPYYHERNRLLTVLVAAAPIVIVVAMAGGYWLSRRALAPVDRLTQAALRISASQLDQRVLIPHEKDELARLAAAFNAMLERLETSFTEMRRFTADAAHELRTPLAVLRSETEVALRSPRSPQEYRNVLASQLEEIDRITRLADQLLFLSREDAETTSTSLSPTDVDGMLAAVAEQLEPAAAARMLSLELDDIPSCRVGVDPDRLRRLFVNLLDNAIKYTDEGGTVRVAGDRNNGTVELRVTDNGRGINQHHLPYIFDRFYRADPARRETEGSGLGLAICQAIVSRHHGAIRVDSTLGKGTTVLVSLPAFDSCATD
ncbi:MAG: HAMP domain-containing protein [Planctomycetota bacterium]|nr:MAG: HAMP domain-containing protein [Planctomycetota bacterium]REJ94756.1 MAG: HAMP domain-containing protein [Planctomycetota bacterium]REK29212.1 MAG: HAMP domain-containing protein [Planctomycetota bacterium]REK29396.1 MAG: HAMP domain-containing protein [Planctomycetota bacterium]